MPFITNRGHRIHYTVDGKGPLLVLQHGLLSNAASWRERGYVEGLSDLFTIACVDSLGHGRSDKPVDPQAYASAHRSRDLVAVMDELGRDRAHLLGYSMGGSMAVGLARRHPERLASLIIGGWDFVSGTQTVADAVGIPTLTFEMLLGGARALAPELTEWITPECEPGLANCFDALGDLDGGAEAVFGLNVPVLLWNGREDPYHDPMQAAAEEHGVDFLSTPGDHVGTVRHSQEPLAGLRKFLEACR